MINKQVLQQNIIDELNLQALDDEKKMALIETMSDVVQKRLTLRLIEEMKDEHKDEFEKILDNGPEKVSEFLQKVFPNFLEMIQEEIVKLKEDLISKFNKNKV
ncbi:MAG: DUF5663 domain-containing protein [Patescibacteria group bacterium]